MQPIEPDLAWRVRATLRSPGYDYPAYVDLATAEGPCRVCLNPFRSGADRAVWFVYDPARGRGPGPVPGPVQIHEEGCQAYRSITPSPVTGLDPALLRSGCGLLLQGFSACPQGGGTALESADGADALGAALTRLFAEPSIEYVHVRRADDGCFLYEVTC
ncbi:hypothetical protein GCM10027456_41800 [Kineosporia babensis]